MILPLISTLDGAESEAPLPSKMRTFWNNVALSFAGGLPCAGADASPTAISESAATTILRDIEFIDFPLADVGERLPGDLALRFPIDDVRQIPRILLSRPRHRSWLLQPNSSKVPPVRLSCCPPPLPAARAVPRPPPAVKMRSPKHNLPLRTTQ